MGGGSTYSVGSVTDSQGNIWSRAVSGVNLADNTDIEIWFANTTSSGNDTINASLAGAGFVQSNVTIAEFNGRARYDAGAAAGSSGTSHSSGTFGANAGDLVVAAYGDGGNNVGVSISDGKSQLGQNAASTGNTESNQSWGGGSSAVFSTSAAVSGEVAAAAFTAY